MTKTDAYVVVTRLAILFTPIVLAAWWYEHSDGLKQAWREFRQRNADHRTAVRMRQMRHRSIERLGIGLDVPRSVMDSAGGNHWSQPTESLSAREGTVQNPSDPSPRPRRRSR